MTNDRIILYDRAGNPLGDLAPSTVFSRNVVEEVNGEHTLTIETSTVLHVGTYALTWGYDGKPREWCVNEPDELHESGRTAIGTYVLPWSLYVDLMAADGSERWVSAEEGTHDPIPARDALPIALADQRRWTAGTIDIDTTGAVSLYDDQVWNYLTKLVGVFGGEIDAEITVGATGVISRKVAWRRHVGSETVRRRFDYGHDLTSIRRTAAEGPYFCGIRPRGGQAKTDNDGVDYTERVGIEDEPAMPDDGSGWFHEANSPYLIATDSQYAFRISDGHGGWLYPMRVMTYDVTETSSGPDAEELLEKAAKDVYDATHPSVTYEATVLAFADAGMDTTGINLGDEVYVIDRGFNEDAPLRVEGRISRVEYDPADVAGTMQLTIGHLAETLAETIRGLAKGTLVSVERRIAVVEGEAARFAAVDATVLVADMARIEALDVDQIAADHAKIGSIDTNQLAADHAVIENLDSNYAHITNGVIDRATIDYADVNDLDAHYAEIDLANVNNAWIENGVVKNESIGDAQIISISANKLTAGTIDASDITVTNLNASNITTGTLNGQRLATGSIDLAKLTESVYTEAEVDAMLAAMDARIDSAIQTWSGDVVPTLSNYPASDWTTTALKDEHIGDVYYVANAGSQADGYSYRFVYDNSTAQYRWALIQDSAVTDALQRLLDAEGDIDGLQSFQSSTARWMTIKDDEVSSLIQSKSDLETALGDKVSSSTFNELSQTVTSNSAAITSLTDTVTDGFSQTTNTVNQVSQTANENSASIRQLQQTVSENEEDIEEKYADLTETVDGITSTVGTISETVDSNERRLTAAETRIQQTAEGIELCATKTEVAEAASYAAGLMYDNTFTETDGTYTFVANVHKGTRDVTDQFLPDMFVWYLRTEDGDELYARGVSMTVDEEAAGYHGTVIGGLEETWDGVLVEQNDNYIVTENDLMISTFSEWEVV